MAWKSLSERLVDLPLLISGPIIRRAEKDNVSVWFVLKENKPVTLKIYPDDVSDMPVMVGNSVSGIVLGTHVFAYCVTAAGGILETGRNYFYDIEFGNGQSLTSLNDGSDEDKRFTYGMEFRPSFALPPDDINKVRLVHGSCRKPHGQGEDALQALDTMISEAVFDGGFVIAEKRPHQLILTGDQIYADDVADLLSFMILDAGEVLFTWDEDFSSGPDIKLFFTDAELKPGKRNLNNKLETATGFTAMLKDSPGSSKSHLLKFRDYAAMYLFVLSDVLWPQRADLPDFSTVFPDESMEKVVDLGNITSQSIDSAHVNGGKLKIPGELFVRFQEELSHIIRFKSKLRKIRRSLANTPVYMIFDDHDVTDDWNLNWRWCRRVYSKKLGKSVVRNGLLSYAIFQAWGNDPGQFEGLTPGGQLKNLIDGWEGNEGRLAEIDQLLNINDIATDAAPRDFVHANNTVSWHFTYVAASFSIISLDTRTWRNYPVGDPEDFAGLICNAGFDVQIRDLPDKAVILVIAPSPVIGVPFIEEAQQSCMCSRCCEKRFERDTEAWPFNLQSFERLFSMLSSRLPVTGAGSERARKGVFTILSGDVHFGLSARYQLWGNRFINDSEDGVETIAVFGQLVSSAAKNYLAYSCCALTTTEFLHLNGYPHSIPGIFFHFVPVIGQLNDDALPNSIQKYIFQHRPTEDRIVGRRTVGEEELNFSVKAGEGVEAFTKEKLTDKGITLTETSDWRAYINWILAEKADTDSSVTPTHVEEEPTDEVLQQYLALARDHGSNYIGKWGDGKEIVGVNNIGEIRFEFGEKKQVNHILWWRLPATDEDDSLEPFPLSTYKIPLNYSGDKDFYGDDIEVSIPD